MYLFHVVEPALYVPYIICIGKEYTFECSCWLQNVENVEPPKQVIAKQFDL